MKPEWKLRAERRVDQVLDAYAAKGVPRVEAARAGIRDLRGRGLHLAGKYGAYTLKYLQRTMKKALEDRVKKAQRSQASTNMEGS